MDRRGVRARPRVARPCRRRRSAIGWGRAVRVLQARASIVGGCALAPDPTTLIVARSVQGVGAALLVPGSLALISASHPRETRGRAIGTWSSTSAITAATTRSWGWLVSHASFRWFLQSMSPSPSSRPRSPSRVSARRGRYRAGKHRPDRSGSDGPSRLGLIVFALLDGPPHRRNHEPCRPRAPRHRESSFSPSSSWSSLEAACPWSLWPCSGPGRSPARMHSHSCSTRALAERSLSPLQPHSGAALLPAAAGAVLVPPVILISAMSPGWGDLVTSLRSLGSARRRAHPRRGFALFARPSVGDPIGRRSSRACSSSASVCGNHGSAQGPPSWGGLLHDHAGVASGVNNAVSRAASVLAIAALGAVLTLRFDDVLDRGLRAISADAGVRALVAAHRGELAGFDLGGVPSEARAPLEHLLEDAYVAGFRAVMLTCACLSALGAALAGWLVEPGATRSDASETSR